MFKVSGLLQVQSLVDHLAVRSEVLPFLGHLLPQQCHSLHSGHLSRSQRSAPEHGTEATAYTDIHPTRVTGAAWGPSKRETHFQTFKF